MLSKVGISQKFLLTSALASGVPLLFFAIVAYSLMNTALLSQAQQHKINTLLQNETNLLIFTQQLEHILEDVASDVQRITAQDVAADLAELQVMLSSYERLAGIDAISIYRPDQPIYLLGQDVAILDLPMLEALRNAPDRPLIWVGSVVDSVGDTSQMMVARWVWGIGENMRNDVWRGQAGQVPRALVVLRVTPQYLATLLHLHHEDRVVLFNADNQMVYNESGLRESVLLSLSDQCQNGVSGTAQVRLNGRLYLCMGRVLDTPAGWHLFNFTPLDVILLPIGNLAWSMAAVLVLAAVLVGVASWLTHRWLVVPIRAVSQHVKKLNIERPAAALRMIVNEKDEIGELKAFVNKLLETLLERQKQDEKVISQALFQQLVFESATEFINITDRNAKTIIETQMLGGVSKFLYADRSYLVIAPQAMESNLPRVFSWYAAGAAQLPPPPSLDHFPTWRARLANYEGVQIYGAPLAELVYSAEELAFLAERDLKGLVLLPILTDHALAGYIGFEFVKPIPGFDTETITLLILVGQIIIISLQKLAVNRENTHMIQQLEESLRFKDQFMTNMSHELRTPLTAVQGYAGLIHDENINEDINYMATRIKANSRRLLALINDILDLSSINAKTVELNPQPLVLRELVQSWYNDYNAQTTEKGLAFVWEYDESLPTQIMADETRLTQIVFNLLHNAIKFTESGKIILSARRATASAGGARTTVPMWCIAVSDTGIGIAEMWHERVFDEFWQLDGSQRRKASGTGLGLSIVAKLARLMGGEVKVQSRLHEGAVFTVTLPLEMIHKEKDS
jgi:signal transduction histidine kinase/HAMP domain-containing protein